VVLALGLALGARTAEPVLGTRPQVFTFALVCWTLWIAESYLRSGGGRLWLLPPLFLLWANLHAGFIAGIGLLVIVVGTEAVKRRWSIGTVASRQRITQLGVAVGASALAACVNPYGPGLFIFAATTGGAERQKGIIEWQSPNFGDPTMCVLLALLERKPSEAKKLTSGISRTPSVGRPGMPAFVCQLGFCHPLLVS
jgi:hypothetical protein